MKVDLPKGLSTTKLLRELEGKPNLTEILSRKDLAALGDSYLNFLYSVALSSKLGRPVGKRIKGSILCIALKESGLRRLLPKRMDRHAQANALEALAAYTWLKELVSFEEALKILIGHEDMTRGMVELSLQMKGTLKDVEKRASLDF